MRLLKEKVIKIAGVEYPLKMTIRAMIEYESMSGHSIGTIETLKDVTQLFYCTLKAGGKDITYDQFMDMIDSEAGILNEFSALMADPVEKKRTASR